MFQTKRKAFDVADQRKATDASGKGIDGDGMGGGGRASNYKPKMPGRGGRGGAGRGAGRGGGGPAASEAADPGAAPKKIPKWKLQSM